MFGELHTVSHATTHLFFFFVTPHPFFSSRAGHKPPLHGVCHRSPRSPSPSRATGARTPLWPVAVQSRWPHLKLHRWARHHSLPPPWLCLTPLFSHLSTEAWSLASTSRSWSCHPLPEHTALRSSLRPAPPRHHGGMAQRRRNSSSHHHKQADNDGDGLLRLNGDNFCAGWSMTVTMSFGSTAMAPRHRAWIWARWA
jgi:hypothetical protein